MHEADEIAFNLSGMVQTLDKDSLKNIEFLGSLVPEGLRGNVTNWEFHNALLKFGEKTKFYFHGEDVTTKIKSFF